jgi:hypothetical protein
VFLTKSLYSSTHPFQIKPKNKLIATVIVILAAAIPSGNDKRPEAAGDIYSGKAMMIIPTIR